MDFLTSNILLSIVVGLGFGLLNFWLLSKVVTGFTQSQQIPDAGQQKKLMVKTIITLVLKMTFLFATIGLILWTQHVSSLAFLGGFTLSLIVAIPARLLIKGNEHHA